MTGVYGRASHPRQMRSNQCQQHAISMKIQSLSHLANRQFQAAFPSRTFDEWFGVWIINLSYFCGALTFSHHFDSNRIEERHKSWIKSDFRHSLCWRAFFFPAIPSLYNQSTTLIPYSICSASIHSIKQQLPSWYYRQNTAAKI